MTIVSIMINPETPAGTRVTAACIILDRAYGRPDSSSNVNINSGGTFIDLLRSLGDDRDKLGQEDNNEQRAA